MEQGATSFLLASAGVFSAGMLYGVRRVMKKEKTELKLYKNQPSFIMACRALGWGTVLCFGAFTAGIVAFSFATGIRSPKEFGITAKKTLVKWGISEEISPERQRQLELESAETVKNIEESWEEITTSISSKLDIKSMLKKSTEKKDD
jgi:hypothetical protein